MREDPNQRWTVDTLHHHLCDKIQELKEATRDKIYEVDKRYEQRWQADQVAINKVNEIRDIVTQLGKDTMTRPEIEARLNALLARVEADASAFENTTNTRFNSDHESITKLQQWQAERFGMSTQGEKASSVNMWLVATVFSIAGTIAGIVVAGATIFLVFKK